MRRLLVLSLLTIGVVALALGQSALATPTPTPLPPHKAPEIDPGQAISALVLLSGALLIVRRKKVNS
jgi:hypothetical protein